MFGTPVHIRLRAGKHRDDRSPRLCRLVHRLGAHLTIARSSVSICGSCLSATGTGARIYANDNTINNCLNGMTATSAGVIESTGNNMIGNCSTPVTGISTVGTY